MNIGVNFFGVSKELYKDFDGTLVKLNKIGVSLVEPLIIFNSASEKDAEQLKKDLGIFSGGIWLETEADDKMQKLKDIGLNAISVHIIGANETPNMLEILIPNLKEFAKKYNIKYYVVSYAIRTIKEIKPFINSLKYTSVELNKSGIQILVHNHDMELLPSENSTVVDYILKECPEVGLELDVGWAKFSKVNSVEYMKKYANRIPILHLKDIMSNASEKTKTSCFTAIGEGEIPLNEIMKEAKSTGLKDEEFIIDQDNSPINDIFRDLIVGIKNIEKAYKKDY